MNMKILLSAVAAVSLISFSTASATVLTAVYKGTVGGGTDEIGMFGAAGENLTGDAYVARYTYDTVGGSYDPLSDYENPSWKEPWAAATFNATLTIKGITAEFAGRFADMVYQPSYNNCIYHDVYDYYWQGDVLIDNEIINGAYGIVGYDPTLPLKTINIYDFGSVHLSSYGFENPDPEGRIYDYSIDLSGYGTLTIGTGSVPEPAIWALMLAGFGLVGATLRRRRLETSLA